MLVVMVETEAAVGEVRKIMAVPGRRRGPDRPVRPDDRRQGQRPRRRPSRTLVEDVAAASSETGTAAGYVCGSAEIAERRLAQGFRFINYGLDHFVLWAAWARSATRPAPGPVAAEGSAPMPERRRIALIGLGMAVTPHARSLSTLPTGSRSPTRSAGARRARGRSPSALRSRSATIWSGSPATRASARS